ncbi:MAG: hypothetical protein PHO74_08110 [Weeksellaceae bacterium]|jgi:hypothetical protein|nr:hypothetical protein [Weeksellaceae bacterium]
MKKLFAVLLVGLVFVSCESMKDSSKQQNGQETEIWEQGWVIINGKITEVHPQQDSQTITLKGSDGVDYKCMVSIEKLGDNRTQYRQFGVGESIGFRGSLSEDNTMVVKEILEHR